MASDPPPPMQPLAPGNFDRAWNDPPLFSYSNPKPGAGSRLTKRVGFPASSGLTLPTGQDPTAPPALHDAGAKPPPCLLPPPPSCLPSSSSPPAPAPTEIPLTTEEVDQILGSMTRQYFALEKATELDKRLGVLVSAHREGGLGSRIQSLLTKLLKALQDSNLTEMNSSFATLSADYGGNAGNAQWMVALRHLVMKVKEQQEQGKEQEGAITAPL